MSADRKLIGARLRTERIKRRVTVQALAEAFRDAASERDRKFMPKLEDLRRQIRGYEAGDHVPRGRNRMLYCAVFEMNEAELFDDQPTHPPSLWRQPGSALNGRFTPDDEERLVLATRRPARIDRAVIESLSVILAEQRRLEDAIGSAPVLYAVKAQLRTVAGLVAEARGPLRPQVVNVAAQWAQFSGWLNIAIADAPVARMSLDRAAEHAEEIGDQAMVGTTLSWKAYLAERTGHVGAMIGMACAAQRNRIGPGQVYDLFLESRGHAITGDGGIAERRLEQAQQAATEAEDADARPWEYYYLEPGFFELETGLTFVYLGRADPTANHRAVEHLDAGLAALPAGMRRSEWAGEYVSHRAAANMQAGNAEAAAASVVEAAEIASATSSDALLRKLRGLHGRMVARWPEDPAVAELADFLR